jgi:arylsulfatase A
LTRLSELTCLSELTRLSELTLRELDSPEPAQRESTMNRLHPRPSESRLRPSLAGLLLACGCWGGFLLRVPTVDAQESDSRPPNIIVILADDLGYGDLQTFGGWIPSPHLDTLASKGLKFTDFHSNGVVCSPTRTALMTGRYQQRAGIPGVIVAALDGKTHNDGIQPQEWTLAEALGEAGYTTGLMGKWHLGYQKEFNPTLHGFDRFRGYISGNVDYFSHIDQAGIEDWWHDDALHQEEGYSTHLITQHAIEFIVEHQQKPFFLLVAHEAPHYPFQGPGDTALRQAGQPGEIQGAREDKKAAYREMVTALDEGVGAIVSKLNELDLQENTLIWFLSDNGAARQGSNLPLRGNKGSVWEGGHRVPAIASWQGVIPAGTTTSSLTMTCDMMPTLLALAQVDSAAHPAFDGNDLTDLLKHPDRQIEAIANRYLFWNGMAVRHGPWKLVRTREGPKQRDQLFNLDEDLGETSNLSSQYPERVKELQRALERWKQDVQDSRTQQPSDRSKSKSP